MPCGMPLAFVTSMNQERGDAIRLGDVSEVLVQEFGRVLGFAPEFSKVSYNLEETVSATD